MRAMQIHRLVSLDREDEPLLAARVPVPQSAPDEVLLGVLACGVCHTELDEIEGRRLSLARTKPLLRYAPSQLQA